MSALPALVGDGGVQLWDDTLIPALKPVAEWVTRQLTHPTARRHNR